MSSAEGRSRIIAVSACSSSSRLRASARWSALGHDDVDCEPNQLGRKRRPPLASPLGPSKLEDDVLALRVTEIAQSFSQWLPGQVGEKGYPRHRRRWLLPLGGERRGEQASQGPEEDASVHRRGPYTKDPAASDST